MGLKLNHISKRGHWYFYFSHYLVAALAFRFHGNAIWLLTLQRPLDIIVLKVTTTLPAIIDDEHVKVFLVSVAPFTNMF